MQKKRYHGHVVLSCLFNARTHFKKTFVVVLLFKAAKSSSMLVCTKQFHPNIPTNVQLCRFYEIPSGNNHSGDFYLENPSEYRNLYHIAVCQRLMEAARGTYHRILTFPTVLKVTKSYKWLEKPNLIKLLL